MTAKEFMAKAKDCAAENKKAHEWARKEEERLAELLTDCIVDIGVQIIGFSESSGKTGFHVYEGIENLAAYLGVNEFKYEDRGTLSYPVQKTFEFDGAKFFELRETMK